MQRIYSETVAVEPRSSIAINQFSLENPSKIANFRISDCNGAKFKPWSTSSDGKLFGNETEVSCRMVDFSHYSTPPMWSFEKSIAKGDELCDGFFDTLLKCINPPLFDPVRMAALRAELCWFEPRVHKGRPPTGCRRKDLAEAVKALNRDDVPASVLNAISERLMRPAEKDRLRKPRNELKRTRMERRDSTIYSVNRELVEALTEGIEPCHPAITELAKSVEGTKKPHEDALKLTHTFLSQKLRLYPPDLRRMRNIILEREKSHRLFVKAVSAKEG